MCLVQQHKYGVPQDGQEQGNLESRFKSPHGTQQLRAIVAHVEKLTHKGDLSVQFMEVEQAGEINGCDDAEMAELLQFSLYSRLHKARSADSKQGRNTFAAMTEETVARQLPLEFRHSQGDEGPPKGSVNELKPDPSKEE
eukprot:g27940.t1